VKYFILSGESSGDLHAAGLVHTLRALDPSPEFMGTGGDQMSKAGVHLVRNISDMAFMGFSEVVKNIFTIRKNFKIIQQAILDFYPDVLILVDYPGFNLRMAKWAKAKGLKVIYYIAPQVWAWRESRVKLLQKFTDLVICILPFEQQYFRQKQVNALYVGHPILEAMPDSISMEKDRTKIALLPGSRKQEIERLLPLMLDAMHLQSPDNLLVAGMSIHGEEYYKSIIGKKARLVMDDVYGVLSASKVALVTSGTATLETALMKVPQVVCYKGSAVSYFIAKRLVRVPHISLVNLILQRPLVPELIQDNCTAISIKQASMEVLDDPRPVLQGYELLRKQLGKGDATKKAATAIFEMLNK
jgi:lipid-A-disaccharide synthase